MLQESEALKHLTADLLCSPCRLTLLWTPTYLSQVSSYSLHLLHLRFSNIVGVACEVPRGREEDPGNAGSNCSEVKTGPWDLRTPVASLNMGPTTIWR